MINNLIKSNNFIKSEKGYFTVESSLIMPLVIFLVISTLLISTIYYQNVISSLDNQELITDFSQYWPNYYKNIETGSIPYNSILKKGIYSNFNFLDSYKDKKIDYLKLLISTRKAPTKLFNDYKINDMYHNVDINIQDYLFSKKIFLKTYSAFNIPFMKNEDKLESSIIEPVSMIRNIDYIVETIKKVKGK